MRRAGLVLAACALAGCGGDEQPRRAASAEPTLTSPRVRPKPVTDVSRVRPGERVVARLNGPALLRSRPGGRVIARLGRETEFKSPAALLVVRRRGDWLGVLAPQAGNGRIGWIAARRAALQRVSRSIAIDLSERRLELRIRRRVVRRFSVAIGRPGAATPIGRFAVTDLLQMDNPGGVYGCCAVALTARQASLPQGWGGGDRIAIHATPLTATIGEAVSLGCLRTTNANLKTLLRTLQLGTPVTIRA